VVHVATEGPLGHAAVAAAAGLGIPLTSSYHTNFDDYARHYRIGPLRGVVEGWLRRLHNRTRLAMAPSADLVRRLESAGFRNRRLWSRGVDGLWFRGQRLLRACEETWRTSQVPSRHDAGPPLQTRKRRP